VGLKTDAPKTMSTDHTLKGETQSQTWDTTIPSTRVTYTLPVKSNEQREKIIGHIVWLCRDCVGI